MTNTTRRVDHDAATLHAQCILESPNNPYAQPYMGLARAYLDLHSRLEAAERVALVLQDVQANKDGWQAKCEALHAQLLALATERPLLLAVLEASENLMSSFSYRWKVEGYVGNRPAETILDTQIDGDLRAALDAYRAARGRG